MEEIVYLILTPSQAKIRESLRESNVENGNACKE